MTSPASLAIPQIIILHSASLIYFWKVIGFINMNNMNLPTKLVTCTCSVTLHILSFPGSLSVWRHGGRTHPNVFLIMLDGRLPFLNISYYCTLWYSTVLSSKNIPRFLTLCTRHHIRPPLWIHMRSKHSKIPRRSHRGCWPARPMFSWGMIESWRWGPFKNGN